MSEHVLACIVCGCELMEAGELEFDDQQLCSDCFIEHTAICSACGDRIWTSEDVGEAGYPLCRDCQDRYYTHCEDCGRLLHRDDAYYADDDDSSYCYSCYESREDYGVIHDYSYRPEPIFYGEGQRFFGVELEIDKAGEDSDNAQRLLDIANRKAEFVYCKHDGSLDDGFEIVTHPMSLTHHLTAMPWQAITENAVKMGYTSHQAKTCGLHVHVNRDGFGEMPDTQDAVIARILYFFEKHWEELLKFSRRTESQLNRWAARYGYKEQPRDILDHAKKGYGGGRYTCVNITNYETIEFRMFRGSLKHNTIFATLQLVDIICDVALSFSDEEIKGLSWTSFVAAIDEEKYPELVAYLKERRLYVNEAFDGGEEI